MSRVRVPDNASFFVFFKLRFILVPDGPIEISDIFLMFYRVFTSIQQVSIDSSRDD
jgi:hypothetical protein